MDSTEIPVYGYQEHGAYNGHFESTCYHPLLLFNREGDCLAGKLRPGSVHSADDWEELVLPEIGRQQKQGREVVFRADAAFAKPEIYEAVEDPRQGADSCLTTGLGQRQFLALGALASGGMRSCGQWGSRPVPKAVLRPRHRGVYT